MQENHLSGGREPAEEVGKGKALREVIHVHENDIMKPIIFTSYKNQWEKKENTEMV